ncbi:hypothetical protein X777_06274 [Ooceraea biroi]|uniref:Uncharacterized protein n=1 Tax=Ooceraea biroi TaxID=2015173 RepID=A0A026WAW3_OOCBI|nr:hypothetical protein X777_06274 [Ooceraea biroi]
MKIAATVEIAKIEIPKYQTSTRFFGNVPIHLVQFDVRVASSIRHYVPTPATLSRNAFISIHINN